MAFNVATRAVINVTGLAGWVLTACLGQSGRRWWGCAAQKTAAEVLPAATERLKQLLQFPPDQHLLLQRCRRFLLLPQAAVALHL